MIIYLDTSALVPLLIHEPTSSACREAWDATDGVLATRLVYVEAAAALAMAERMGRITAPTATTARAMLARLWKSVMVIEIDEPLMHEAARISVDRGLRGYDAVHCAAAATANDDLLVGVAGDQALIVAWQAEGIATMDTNGPPHAG